MSDSHCDTPTLRRVDAYEKSLCPWCGAHPDKSVFADGQTIESPLLRQAPWADAVLLSWECQACGETAREVEISVVAEAPGGNTLLNDHCYKAAAHTLYLAGRGRRQWPLVHRVNVSGMRFVPQERSLEVRRDEELEVPWLDEHTFGPMAWRSGWDSAVKLTEMMLPCLRRITWPIATSGRD